MLGTTRFIFAVTVSLASLVALPSVPVRAQQETATPSVAAAPAFTPPTTLAAGLKNMEWRAVQRGPLFAVNPQSVRLWQPKRDPHLPPDAPKPDVPKMGPPDGPNNGYRPDTLAPFFGRKLVKCGSVTVFAPTEMTVLATNLKGAADPMAGLRRDEKIKLLQASLTDTQWKQMGSPAGLGADSMDATQRGLFLSLLPDPCIVTQFTTDKNGMTMWGGDKNAPQKTTLSGGERQQIRLRMNRTTRMTIPRSNDKNGYGGEWVSTQPENQTIYQVSQANEYGNSDAFGVLLKDTVPARLKPGQLEWDAPALDGEVDLRGAKTVGDLVARIAKASGLELVADARVARLSLWVYGDPIPSAPVNPGRPVPASAAPAPPETAANAEPAPARAGDVLKALCWAVTGTIRKVGPVYLLTDDIEGIATRQARINRWKGEADNRKYQLLSKYDKDIRAHQPLQYTGFSAGDPAALDAGTMAKVEAGWNNSQGRYRGVTQPTSDLSDAQQKMVRRAIENHQTQAARGGRNVQPIVLDKVQVSVSTKMMYVLPGDKEADCDIYMSLSSFLPPPMPSSYDGKPLPSTDPVTLPPVLEHGGVVQVSPRNIEDVRVILEAAKERGLRGVWMVLDGLDGTPLVSPDLLKQATQMGKEKGVPVSAVVRLLLAPTTAAPSASPDASDRNVIVSGETGAQLAAIAARVPEQYPGANLRQTLYYPKADWLRPDAPLVPVVVKRRLLDVADTPNLAGVVVTNAAAPGYREKEASPYGDSFDTDFGYTLQNRIACLRAAHVDPIDMGSSDGYGETNLGLPFFTEGQSMTWTDDGTMKVDKKVVAPRTIWKTQRLEQNVKFLSNLYQAFRAAQPNLPLFIADFDEGYGTVPVIAWEKADALPISTPYDYSNDDNNLSDLAQARKLSKTVLMNVMCGYAVIPRYPDSYDDGIVPGTGKAFARLVNRYLRPMQEIKNAAPGSHPTWDGLVLDFGEVPVATAAELIRTGMAPGVPQKNAVNR